MVLWYSAATSLVVVLPPRGTDPAPLLINTVLLFLLIGFAIARGGNEGWAIMGSVFAASAVGLFFGHRLLGLPLWLGYSLEIPIATGLTYLLVDRRSAIASPKTATPSSS